MSRSRAVIASAVTSNVVSAMATLSTAPQATAEILDLAGQKAQSHQALRHRDPDGHDHLRVVPRAPGRDPVRLGELDSLRGLAALAVSFAHIFAAPVGVAGAVIAVISLTPLHALYEGQRAVLFFFVLSGFVLALPFFRGQVSPTAFVVKRAARLYPAYLVVIAASIGASSILLGDPHLDWGSALSYASMVSANTPGYDGVVWSLAHEMRLSIVFPLLMIPIVKFPSRWVLVSSLALVAAGFWVGDTPRSVVPIATVFYAFFFVLGRSSPSTWTSSLRSFVP